MKELKRCRCAEPDETSGGTQSVAAAEGVIECVICGSCGGLIRQSTANDHVEPVDPLVEFEFDETRSWFAQPVNYWGKRRL